MSAATAFDVVMDPDYRLTWDDASMADFDICKLDGYNDIGYYASKKYTHVHCTKTHACITLLLSLKNIHVRVSVTRDQYSSEVSCSSEEQRLCQPEVMESCAWTALHLLQSFCVT